MERRALERLVDQLPLSPLAVQLLRPATPAALVLNESGEIAYFGPYSDGAFCSSRGSRFIENTLDALLKGDVSSQLNMAAYGCYCDWKTPNA